MLLSHSGEYALRALIFLAQNGSGGPLRTQEIAAELGLPRNYLSKLLHRLVGAGVLKSVSGPRGGFLLAVAPAKLSLAAALEPIDGDLFERRCLLGRAECNDARACPVHAHWRDLSKQIHSLLENTTLAALGPDRNRARSRRRRH